MIETNDKEIGNAIKEDNNVIRRDETIILEDLKKQKKKILVVCLQIKN